MLLPFHHLDDTDAAIGCATVKFQWNFWMLRDQRLKPQPSSDLKFQLLAEMYDTYLTKFPRVFQSTTYQSHLTLGARWKLGGTD